MSKRELILLALAIFILPGILITLADILKSPVLTVLSRIVPPIAYFGGAIYALSLIRRKGYLTGISIVLAVLFGWWAIFILAFLSPLTLIIAAVLPERIKCPHCKSYIPVNAARCPHCTGELAVQTEKILENKEESNK